MYSATDFMESARRIAVAVVLDLQVPSADDRARRRLFAPTAGLELLVGIERIDEEGD